MCESWQGLDWPGLGSFQFLSCGLVSKEKLLTLGVTLLGDKCKPPEVCARAPACSGTCYF